MKFYIGSSIKNIKEVNYYIQYLEKKGWICTYNWCKNVSKDTTISDLEEYARKEKNAIVNSDVVIILLPTGRGSNIELGMALALDKKIYICGESNDFTINNSVCFYYLDNISRLTYQPIDNLNIILNCN